MDDKLQKLADQVAGKIHWGAPREEVHQWLVTEKKLQSEVADSLIDQGFKKRRAEVRHTAVIRGGFAGIGLLLFAFFLAAQYFGQFVVVGIPVFITWGIGITCLAVVIHSLQELVTGNSDRPM